LRQLSPREKQLAAGGGAVVFLLLLAALLWARGDSRIGRTGAFQLKCASCGAEFSIGRGDLAGHPRSSKGEGLRCRKCGQFAARIANRCPRCHRWFIPDAASDAGSRCPYCYPSTAPVSARQGR
jgi:DNA-directed RNA polymerase subunit RPC12/RpoP